MTSLLDQALICEYQFVVPNKMSTEIAIKAKFHYAIWFEACQRPASNQLRTS